MLKSCLKLVLLRVKPYVTEVTGTVETWEDGKKYVVQVTPEDGHVENLELNGRTVTVKSGSNVKVGDVLATSENEGQPLCSSI